MVELDRDRLLAFLSEPVTERQADVLCATAEAIAEAPEWTDILTLGQALRAEQLDPLEWVLDAPPRRDGRRETGDADGKAMHVLMAACRTLTEVGRPTPVEPVLLGWALWILHLLSRLPRLNEGPDGTMEPALWWRIERDVLVLSSAERRVLTLHLFWPRLPVADLEALRLLVYRLVVFILDARPQQEIGLA